MINSKILLISKFLTTMFCFLMLSCAPEGEKVVKLPFHDNIPSFVPYYWQTQHILAQGTIFEGLFGYEPDPEGLGGVKIVPVIADTWEVSDDGKVWTFKLRKDKKWSNGDPVTAKDFEWTSKYMCDPSIPDVPLWACHLQHVKNGWPAKGGGVPMDELGVRTLDDYTIEFTLAYPRFDFNCWLVVGGSMPLHRATVEKYGPNEWWKPENFVGNGPYIPESWTANKEAVLVKNPNYVGERGNVDKFILKNFAFGISLMQPYQAGEIDMALISNVGDYTYAIKNSKLKNDFHEETMNLFWSGYQLSRGFNKVLDDVNIRKAFAISIDRETLCKTVMGGRTIPIGSYWASDDPIGSKMTPITYDVPLAKKLLADAGYPDGKGLPDFHFYVTGNMPEAEFVAKQWQENLGVKIKIENLEDGVYWSSYVWSDFTPNAKPGFTRINAPMNSLEVGSLYKNTNHTYLFYDMSTANRREIDSLKDTQVDFLTTDGGTSGAEWNKLTELNKKLIVGYNKKVNEEPNEYWKRYFNLGTVFYEQFEKLTQDWKSAKTDKEKTKIWRIANRLLLKEKEEALFYYSLSPESKAAYRLHLEIQEQDFNKAIEMMPEFLQILQDRYFMVPLFMEKAQYVLRSNISGLMIYKFSFGPSIFNLKYININ